MHAFKTVIQIVYNESKVPYTVQMKAKPLTEYLQIYTNEKFIKSLKYEIWILDRKKL